MARTAKPKPIVLSTLIQAIDGCLYARQITRSASYERSVRGYLATIETHLSMLHAKREDPALWECFEDYKNIVCTALTEKDLNSTQYFGSSGFEGLHLGQRLVLLASIRLDLHLEEFPEERSRFGY